MVVWTTFDPQIAQIFADRRGDCCLVSRLELIKGFQMS